MSPRTSDQWNAIRQEKRQVILDTALTLFAQGGYHETPISLIAKEAGVSKGLIYNYFESKESLLNEIVSLGLDELIKELKMEGNACFTKEQLVRYIDITFLKLQENPKFYQLFLSLFTQPRVLSIFQDKFFNQILPLLILLEKYYEAKGKEDPKAQAYLFMAVLDGVGMDFIANREHFPLAEIKKLVIEIFT
ncbi:MAG: TetR/AcrR family transcriptional regulator [Bacteroidales bacterium]|nr:TetR/AcrR family transcriptional regulator [Bacteroidales bacterium]